MHTVLVIYLFGIIAVSSSIPHGVFRFDKLRSFRHNEDTCRVCYGDDCAVLTQAGCDYYEQTTSILDEEDAGNGERTVVDAMVYDFVEYAAQSWSVQECLPLVSGYTNCNKDNICIGCKSCQCSLGGRWICRDVQQCQPQAALQVDHLILENTINALNNNPEEKSPIYKRSITNNGQENNIDKKMTLAGIAKWMYEVTPSVLKSMDNGTISREITHITDTTDNQPRESELTGTPETDYLDFAEVLKNIANDGSHYRRRKLHLNNSTNYNNTDVDDIKVTYREDSSKAFIDILNAIEEGNSEVIESHVNDATLVVDLLQHKNLTDGRELNETDDIINILNKDINNAIDYHDSNNYRITSLIKKRDILFANESGTIGTSTTEIAITPTVITVEDNDLNNTVLVPLMNIIKDKQNELNDLLQIQENLLNHVTKISLNNTTERSLRTGSNPYVSIYKVDLLPEVSSSLRNNNENTLGKLLYKLKHDIYEVRRDIGAIQKITKVNDLPTDLKMLINAMKRYNHRQHNSTNAKDNIETDEKITRRNDDDSVSIKGQFINILEELRKQVADSNVMEIMSRHPKQIIKRVVNNFNAEEVPTFSMRLSNNNYNITNDLKSIGSNWQQLTNNVEKSSPAQSLHALKLLHLTLCKDINKISNVISVIDFFRSRRMFLIEKPDDGVLDQINRELDSVRHKVDTLTERKKNIKDNTDTPPRKSKKKTFIQKIRNLLRNAKKEIVEMSSRNIHKSEIVRTIATKKLDEITLNQVKEDEKTMVKWQNDLKVL